MRCPVCGLSCSTPEAARDCARKDRLNGYDDDE